MKKVLMTTVLFLSTLCFLHAQTEWAFDVSHSSIQFSVKHMVISHTTGQFNQFDGSVTSTNEDFTDSQIELTIDVNSIDTEDEKRDQHLKASDFFDAEKYPTITFKSTAMKKVEGEEDKYILIGDFTIKDSTKSITLDVTYGGQIKDPWGNTRAGFQLGGEIDRFDYGLKYNGVLETGGLMIGKKVKLTANVELIQKKAEAKETVKEKASKKVEEKKVEEKK